MTNIDYKAYVKSYPDFPKPGIMFRDIFPLISDVTVFKAAIKDIAKKSAALKPDKILLIEARGFIVGTALSLEMGVSMIPARKMGKLPGKTISYEYTLEYGKDVMQIPVNVIQPGDRVLLADDVLATGGTAKTAAKLVNIAKGIPVGLASVMELEFLNGRKLLNEHDIEVVTLMKY